MLTGQKIMAFLVTCQPDKARDFYQNELGLKLIEEHEFSIVFDAAGIELRLQKVPEHVPLAQTALGWAVADIAAMVARLEAADIEMVRYGWMDQDAAGIWQTPDGARICWFKDPDGNLLSLTQH